MKKKLTLAVLLLFVVNNILAQQCQFNGDFEVWDTVITPNEKYSVPKMWHLVQGACHNPTIENGEMHHVYRGHGSLLLNNDFRKFEPAILVTKIECGQKPRGLGFYSMTQEFDSAPFIIDVKIFSKSNLIVANGLFTADSTYYKQASRFFHKTEIIFNYQSTEEPDSMEIKLISGIEDNYSPGSSLFLDSMHLIFGALGVVENLEHNHGLVKVSPNPTKGVFTITVSEVKTADDVSIQVYDQLGSNVSVAYGIIKNESSVVIDSSLEGYAPGIYYIECFINNRVHPERQKLVHW